MGRGNMRRYRQLRSELADAGRTKRIREARKFLDTIGFDRARGDRIRAAYLREAQKLRDLHSVIAPPTRRLPLDECSPWVTYMAPYHGWSWAFAWSRSDEPDDPVLARYLDSGTGHIGSSISVRVSGADDDDSLQADYHTALNVWHTTLATGVLEAYLAFEVNATPYSGKVTDEFGFSNATFQQWAGARLRVVDTQGAFEMQETQIHRHGVGRRQGLGSGGVQGARPPLVLFQDERGLPAGERDSGRSRHLQHDVVHMRRPEHQDGG